MMLQTEASAEPIDALELRCPFSDVETRYWILIIRISHWIQAAHRRKCNLDKGLSLVDSNS